MNKPINDNILAVISQTPDSVLAGIASRVKAQRLELNFTQKALASRSGVSLPTYRRFETTGEISLRSLVKIALALRSLEGFEHLFSERKYETMDQLLQAKDDSGRQRGRRND